MAAFQIKELNQYAFKIFYLVAFKILDFNKKAALAVCAASTTAAHRIQACKGHQIEDFKSKLRKEKHLKFSW